jgi:hypothetical protein
MHMQTTNLLAHSKHLLYSCKHAQITLSLSTKVHVCTRGLIYKYMYISPKSKGCMIAWSFSHTHDQVYHTLSRELPSVVK